MKMFTLKLHMTMTKIKTFFLHDNELILPHLFRFIHNKLKTSNIQIRSTVITREGIYRPSIIPGYTKYVFLVTQAD